MNLRTVAIAFAVVVSLAVLGLVGVYLSYPGDNDTPAAPNPVTAEDAARNLAALKPPKRARPVIAVVGANEGSETTDYLIPYGVLKRSGVADVVSFGLKPGPVMLMP